MNRIQFKKPDEYKEGEIILFTEQIQQRIRELAQEIATQYLGKRLLVIGILKGAFLLTSDLAQALHEEGLTDVEVEFLTLRSYHSGTTASSEPQIVETMSISPAQREVLVIDDIIDTGKSLQLVEAYLREKQPVSLATFALLDKPSRRTVTYQPDFVGFTIPDIWVQGYGMDTDERGRVERNIIKGPYSY